MGTNVNYRDYNFILRAGVAQQLKVAGDYYQVITANGAIVLQFDQGVTISRQQSMGGPANYVDSVTVTSPIDQTVVLSLGTTNGMVPYDSRGDFSADTINVSQRIANTITPLPDVSVPAGAAASLVGADATAVDVIIALPSTESGPVRIGDSTVDGTHGFLLEPGSTLVVSGTPAIYAYNPNALAIKLTLTKTRLV